MEIETQGKAWSEPYGNSGRECTKYKSMEKTLKKNLTKMLMMCELQTWKLLQSNHLNNTQTNDLKIDLEFIQTGCYNLGLIATDGTKDFSSVYLQPQKHCLLPCTLHQFPLVSSQPISLHLVPFTILTQEQILEGSPVWCNGLIQGQYFMKIMTIWFYRKLWIQSLC